MTLMQLNDSHQWLVCLTVQNLLDDVKPQETLPAVICAPEDATVETALALLKHAKVSALPVYAADTATGRQVYTKILTMFDLMHHIAFQTLFYQQQYAETQNPEQILATPQKWIRTDFLKTPLGQVQACVPPSDPLVTVQPNHSLLHLVKAFCAHHLHHAVVVKPTNLAMDAQMVSQKDLLQFFYRHRERFGMWLEDTMLSALMENKPPLVLLHESVSALTGFQKMAVHRGMCTHVPLPYALLSVVNALAVVNDAGALVADLRASHLKHLDQMDKVEWLRHPVLEFLRLIKAEVAPLTSVPQTTVGRAMERMFREQTHRVWVVENAETQKPLQVITMSDLLQDFLHLLPKTD